jgi:hypothetical protein
MSLGRLLMLFGLVLVPVGLVYGMTTLNGGDSKAAMFTELGCLAAGALVFLLGRRLERKGS